jgi:hypothetical protein
VKEFFKSIEKTTQDFSQFRKLDGKLCTMLNNLKTIWLSIGKLVKLILIIFSDEFFLFIPIYSTWKRCKHSGHFSRFRNIIGNFCIIKQKCLCNYVINLFSEVFFSVFNKVNKELFFF